MFPQTLTIKGAVAGAIAATFAILLCLLSLATWAWRHEVNAYAEFRAQVTAEGEAAKVRAKQENDKHEQAKKDTAEEWKAKIAPAQDEAVRRYRAAHPVGLCASSGSGGLPQGTSGAQGTHGEAGKPLVDSGSSAGTGPSDEFIKACGHDAFQVMMWQSWATKNGLPIE